MSRASSLLPFYPLLLSGQWEEQMGGGSRACRYGEDSRCRVAGRQVAETQEMKGRKMPIAWKSMHVSIKRKHQTDSIKASSELGQHPSSELHSSSTVVVSHPGRV